MKNGNYKTKKNFCILTALVETDRFEYFKDGKYSKININGLTHIPLLIIPEKANENGSIYNLNYFLMYPKLMVMPFYKEKYLLSEDSFTLFEKKENTEMDKILFDNADFNILDHIAHSDTILSYISKKKKQLFELIKLFEPLDDVKTKTKIIKK